MRFASKAVVAAGLGFSAAAVVGCGSGGDLLSNAQATQLRTELSHAAAALNANECGSAAGYISDFQDRVNDLGSVNQTLVNNLQAGATKIESLAARECPTDTTPAPTHTTPHRRPTPPPTTPTGTTNTSTTTTTTSTATTSSTSSTATTNTDTGTESTTTGTGTGTTSTNSYTQPGLTGPSTTSSTSSTSSTATSPASGGGGLSGGGGF